MPLTDADYDRFVGQVFAKTCMDLAQYKRQQMQRRITALCERRGYSDFQAYFNALSANDAMMQEFLERMTINVSEFFRNPDRWDVLRTRVLPHLLRETTTLRLWSAACSTGEEAYSLVLLLLEEGVHRFSVCATDIDEHAIHRAKQAQYAASAVQNVPPAVLDRHFRESGSDRYVLDPRIVSYVTFAKHNLLSDAVPGLFDLILCRNVLIYFTEEAKEGVYGRLARALRPGGILFVGGTEQIFAPDKYELSIYDTFFYAKGSR